jgi:hypothetical protein
VRQDKKRHNPGEERLETSLDGIGFTSYIHLIIVM